MLLVQNDGTGDEEIGNYHFEVRINKTVLAKGQLAGFHRELGWRRLLEKVLREISKLEKVDSEEFWYGR
jgi:hypothetical protein